MSDVQATLQDPQALWRYTVGLIIEKSWQELLDNLHTTTQENVLRALCYGLHYSRHDDPNRQGYISTVIARTLLMEMGIPEPRDRAALMRTLLAPSPCQPHGGTVNWPVNAGFSMEPKDKVWALVFGIEAGWLAHDRAGFLGWTQRGRDHYAAGDALMFTEANGQNAFAF